MMNFKISRLVWDIFRGLGLTAGRVLNIFRCLGFTARRVLGIFRGLGFTERRVLGIFGGIGLPAGRVLDIFRCLAQGRWLRGPVGEKHAPRTHAWTPNSSKIGNITVVMSRVWRICRRSPTKK